MATDPVQIGTRIARRRHQLRITQAQLAADLDVSKSTVANWERGKHSPARHLGALELRLGIRLDGEEPRRPDPRLEMLRTVDLLRREADRIEQAATPGGDGAAGDGQAS
jgi:transcriptional regulator with XRE-family HTH domain